VQMALAATRYTLFALCFCPANVKYTLAKHKQQ
jgi:hypothetical protein